MNTRVLVFASLAAFVALVLLVRFTNIYVLLTVTFAAVLAWVMKEWKQKKSKDPEHRPRKRLILAYLFLISVLWSALFWSAGRIFITIAG